MNTYKYEKRWEKIREIIKKEGYDAFISKKQGNTRYLCCSSLNFISPMEYLIISKKSEPIGITSSLEAHKAKNETAINDIKIYSNYPGVSADSKNAITLLKKILLEKKIKKCLTDNKIKIRNIKIKNKDIVQQLRMLKDEDEIRKIKKACELADYGVKILPDIIKEKKTEQKIANELDYILREKGASGMAFNTIIAGGKHSSYPHHDCTSKQINNGYVVCDFGVYYNGYCSDITRTLQIGNVSEKMIELYNIVLEAQKNTINSITQNKTCKEIDLVARNIFKDYGYDKYFVHSTGHGIGLEVHEEPKISPASKEKIKKGFVFTIEPGVYIPSKYGIRIEDVVYINSSGRAILLTKSKK